jgi:hypothetical protein
MDSLGSLRKFERAGGLTGGLRSLSHTVIALLVHGCKTRQIRGRGRRVLGPPFAATGARILSQAIKELAALPKGSRAIVSICTDGALGTVALLQN